MQNSKNITILGATGSVGMQAVDVARKKGYKIDGVSCNSSIETIEKIVREFDCKYCAVENSEAGSLLKASLKDTNCKVIVGENSASTLASITNADTILNSVTGVAGLKPTIETLKNGKNLALANKESLVTAGFQVMKLAKEKNLEMLPVDSEHSAVWQSLRSGNYNEIKRIILTASGGPFFGYNKEQLSNVTSKEALKHPTWNMGKKITIDSATLMNKGFEVIEAAWLFNINADKIDVVVHRESIIHSMVEYIDNAVIAQLGVPDMRTCIQYALTYPVRSESVTQSLDFTKLNSMTFYSPDINVFPLLSFARKVYNLGGSYGAALNGSNEVAVDLFLKDKINLPTLFELVMEATLNCGNDDLSLETVFEVDKESRRFVLEKYNK